MTVKPLEYSVENELVRRVHEAGGVAWKIRFIGQRGCPDRLVMLPGGKIFLVETKRPKGGVISTNQHRIHAKCRELSFDVVVIKNRADIDIFMALARQ